MPARAKVVLTSARTFDVNAACSAAVGVWPNAADDGRAEYQGWAVPVVRVEASG